MVELPEHHIFVELTGAHSSLFLHKQPSPNDVVLDLHSIIYHLYKHILNDPHQWASKFPTSSLTDQWLLQHSTYDPLPKFILPNIILELQDKIPQLPNIYKHILRLQLEQGPFYALINRYKSDRTLFYADFADIPHIKIADKYRCFQLLEQSQSKFIFKDNWNPNYKSPRQPNGDILITGGVSLGSQAG